MKSATSKIGPTKVVARDSEIKRLATAYFMQKGKGQAGYRLAQHVEATAKKRA